ncbi:MAG: hypothetical protein BGP24_02440 [Lysobacterales bacterium 69-70]|nr:hypothetical protein [Xanthomonadaceae bacterium]ODU31899.1 MAG: hypothetical protein ABS97_16710 [Xanthomonadaceae bacterium SCN 69-320]ODV19956.1 MAG: hypothetical protein ABT27_08635 [Xanthomonadaceae bacterium SCN 69-25]OJZ01623.1 MAG: hypothetical protein BGP24_02440 [Xanthomonadales bacterium 69-70]
MPVEIRELVIRATVDPVAGRSGGPDSCGMPQGKDGKEKGGAPAGNGDSPTPDGDLVQACVREVMRILERKGER